MSWILPLLILGGALAVVFMRPEERMAVLRRGQALLRQARGEVFQRWAGRPTDARETRPPLPLVTSAIVISTVLVFVRMRMGGGPGGGAATLVSWGGSFGPRTTNGEWWRLVTAMFVHRGWVDLLAMLAGFVQVARITERVVGRFAFVSVYLAGGILANLVCLSTSPVTVAVGASGAVLAMYGLLAATWLWGLLRSSPVRIPWRTAKRLVPGVALFVLYTIVAGPLDRAAGTVACAWGAIAGFLLAKGAVDHKPAVRRIAVLTADVAALVVLTSVPLRGMADVAPIIERVTAMETRTSATYDAQVARFRSGTTPATALAQLIDRTIRPELDAAKRDILALRHVPREHQPLVALALQYLRLRDDSWRLRADGLRRSQVRVLREADRREWEAWEVLRQMSDLTR